MRPPSFAVNAELTLVERPTYTDDGGGGGSATMGTAWTGSAPAFATESVERVYEPAANGVRDVATIAIVIPSDITINEGDRLTYSHSDQTNTVRATGKEDRADYGFTRVMGVNDE